MESTVKELNGIDTRASAKEMTGAEMVIEALIEQGIEQIFGYPGGTVLPLYDAFMNQSFVRHIRTAHEQGAVHAAAGFARASGKAGVVLVTSGPGATNTVTGIADAYADSTPLVVLTGQVGTPLIGTNAFQECDIVGITSPCTKRNYQVKNVADLPRILHEAFHVAQSGRPGPVLIDLPKDVQTAKGFYGAAQIGPCAKPNAYSPSANDEKIKQAIALMQAAERPVFYTGGGVVTSGPEASNLLRELVQETGFPVTSTLMGMGAFPASSDQWLGMLGMHGTFEANMTVHNADLIIAIGARFDDRVVGAVKKFAPGSKKIHIDIDPRSIDKIVRADLGIQADCKAALDALVKAWRLQGTRAKDLTAWRNRIGEWRKRDSLAYESSTTIIKPQYAMQRLDKILKGKDAYVVTDVGQHQMWVAQYLGIESPIHLITSGGMGTMGYGLPAAIGAQTAHPDSLVVCVTGDGSFQMCVQEMIIAREQNLPIKVLLINNHALGMVRQWQQMFYEKRYSQSLVERQPDFVKLAQAYDWDVFQCKSPQRLDSSLKKMIETEGPYLLDCHVDRGEICIPIIPPGAGYDEMILPPKKD